MKDHYETHNLYYDLLAHASKLLKPNGRIVFLYHTDTSLPDDKNKFPEHPDFEFVCSSINDLTKCRARHLITMIKK
jgi:tRNA G10  N-methylase Trm11